MAWWDVGAPLTDDLCLGDVGGHPAGSLHSCSRTGGLWSHQSSVICMLQLKDPHSVQLGGGLQPPDVKEVAIEPIDDCHPAVVLNVLMEQLGDAEEEDVKELVLGHTPA